MFFHIFKYGSHGGSAHRVAVIGVSVHESAATVFDRLYDVISGYDAASRHIAGGHALSGGDYIRHDIPMVHTEILAGTATPSHNLVRYKKDVIPVTYFANHRPISVRRNNGSYR
ncbi:hypothetical protein SDC9_204680 [bioreactor metagenome]|uniref:Uncharacterized protein n=1 Tax=bioreactor metagenome TaxID=1076179 RepID=A0A645J0L0_9ZZZZ